jgi:hypothetical protein
MLSHRVVSRQALIGELSALVATELDWRENIKCQHRTSNIERTCYEVGMPALLYLYRATACNFCKPLIEDPHFTETLPFLYHFSIFAVVKSAKTKVQQPTFNIGRMAQSLFDH